MSSPATDAPLKVAKLCSNCRRAQFRDDIPQLYQSGPHLELDREQLHEYDRSERTGGFLGTEFALTDSYPDLPELWRSSQDGCEFCKFLHEIVVSFTSQDLDINKMPGCTMLIVISYSWATLYQDDEEEIPEIPNGLDAMLITAAFASNHKEDHKVKLRVVCHVESACYSDPVSNWLHLSNRSKQQYCDADSVQWMKDTLDNCSKSHEHDVFEHAYIPELLIDVRPQMPRITLRGDHKSLDCVSAPKYTALSYCWGSGKGQATTTLATLSDRRVGIADSELPQVVRDAIQVTRALGISFLWVDALCILQDDPSDWARQCTEMHNIYGSAHVTFCAANSGACDEGFLRQTGHIIRIPFQSRQAPDIEGSFLIQYKGLVDHIGNLDSSFLFNDLSFSNWNSRGWVFQEKILSTRRLVFGGRDLYFLCDKFHQRRGKDTISGAWDRHISKSKINEDLCAVHDTWNGVLGKYGSYNTCSFTNATDILPALSGLAQIFHDRLKDDYYAGHWRRSLYRSLLWFQIYKHRHFEPFWSASFSNPVCEALAIPSWSNLAKGHTRGLDQHMFYDRNGWHDCRSEIHLLHAKVILAGTNPFGSLTDCSLRLRGYTLNLSHQEVGVLGPQFEEWGRGTFSLIVRGRCFGVLNFDCKPVLHVDGGKCVSEGEFGHFKLLLLMWFDYLVPEAKPTNLDSGPEPSTEHSSSEDYCGSQEASGEREQDGTDYSHEATSDAHPMGRRGLSSQEDTGRQKQMSGEEAPAASHDRSDENEKQQDNMQGNPGKSPWQTKDVVRKGFGLIICPTGNDREFYRVGMFSPIVPRSVQEIDAGIPIGDLGGDIRQLQSLAQVETVDLV